MQCDNCKTSIVNGEVVGNFCNKCFPNSFIKNYEIEKLNNSRRKNIGNKRKKKLR